MNITQTRWRARLDSVVTYMLHRGVSMRADMSYLDLLVAARESGLFSDADITALQQLMSKGLAGNNNGGEYDFKDPAEVENAKKDYIFVVSHFPNEVIYRLNESVDYAAAYDAEQAAAAAARRRKNRKILAVVGSVAAALILGIVIYNLPYFKEKRAYARTIDNPCGITFNQYVAEYDNPEHLPDVLYRSALYSLHHEFSGESHQRSCIDGLSELIAKFPDHPLAARAEVTIDSIWEAEVNNFVKSNPDYESKPALRNVYGMLDYMRQNRQHEIALNLSSDVNLKEYHEYDQLVRDFLESDDPMLRSRGVLSLKENFTEGDRESLERLLTDGFEKSLNKLFSHNFFTVSVNKDSDAVDPDDKRPVINLHYNIRTQSQTFGPYTVPDLWVYSDNVGHATINKSFIMGIDVSFNSSLTYPGQTEPMRFAATGDPAEEIRGITSIKDGYRIMTKRCFEHFASNLFTTMGLDNEVARDEDDEEV